jgi:hypothetical protein
MSTTETMRESSAQFSASLRLVSASGFISSLGWESSANFAISSQLCPTSLAFTNQLFLSWIPLSLGWESSTNPAISSQLCLTSLVSTDQLFLSLIPPSQFIHSLGWGYSANTAISSQLCLTSLAFTNQFFLSWILLSPLSHSPVIPTSGTCVWSAHFYISFSFLISLISPTAPLDCAQSLSFYQSNISALSLRFPVSLDSFPASVTDLLSLPLSQSAHATRPQSSPGHSEFNSPSIVSCSAEPQASVPSETDKRISPSAVSCSSAPYTPVALQTNESGPSSAVYFLSSPIQAADPSPSSVSELSNRSESAAVALTVGLVVGFALLGIVGFLLILILRRRVSTRSSTTSEGDPQPSGTELVFVEADNLGVEYLNEMVDDADDAADSLKDPEV